MTPEELAKIWHNELHKANEQYKPWDALTDESKKTSISVADEVLTHQGLPWPKISQQTVEEIRNLMNWLEE